MCVCVFIWPYPPAHVTYRSWCLHQSRCRFRVQGLGFSQTDIHTQKQTLTNTHPHTPSHSHTDPGALTTTVPRYVSLPRQARTRMRVSSVGTCGSASAAGMRGWRVYGLGQKLLDERFFVLDQRLSFEFRV